MFIILHDVLGKNKSLLEAAINFAQFPEDQNKKNRDHEQQELDIHFVSPFVSPLHLTPRNSCETPRPTANPLFASQKA